MVAVSGGADSVGLLRCLCDIRLPGPGKLIVAHYNHRWREVESAADAAFVAELAQQLGLPYVGGEASTTTPPEQQREAAARQQRYRFLETTALAHGARFLVTAHTWDDQVETILFRMVRGTGLRGLAGMRPARRLNEPVTLIRPFLPVRRVEIEAYLEQLAQPFRRDSSNANTEFARNMLRHEILPQLERSVAPAARESIYRLGRLAAEVADFLEAAAAQELERAWCRIASSRPADLESPPTTNAAPTAAGGQPTNMLASHAAPRSAERLKFTPNLPAPLRVEVLRLLWRELGWSEQSMTERHWRELSTPPTAGDPVPRHHNLPDDIRAVWLSPTELTLDHASNAAHVMRAANGAE